jgi:hypothetical protein
VEARLLRQRNATRGILLVSVPSLLDYIGGLPAPESPTSPTAKAREAAAAAAQLDAECAEIDRRPDLSDVAKGALKAEIRAGKLRLADVAKPEATA